MNNTRILSMPKYYSIVLFFELSDFLILSLPLSLCVETLLFKKKKIFCDQRLEANLCRNEGKCSNNIVSFCQAGILTLRYGTSQEISKILL